MVMTFILESDNITFNMNKPFAYLYLNIQRSTAIFNKEKVLLEIGMV